MSQESKRPSVFIGLLLVIGLSFMFSSCGKGRATAEKSQPPAKVENAVKESELTKITLSPKAEERLGIEVVRAEQRRLPGVMKVGGEVMAVPGNEVQIAAPAAGMVLKAKAGPGAQAGRMVKKGEEILQLMFLPPERDLIGAREELSVRQMQMDVAQAKADRAKQLLASKAVSQKEYEEAQVEWAKAKGALLAAQARLNLLSGTELDATAGSLSTIVLESPFDGVLLRIFVAPGQTVPSSTPLFEVARQNPLWVRVPVYVGDLSTIELETDATVQSFGAAPQTARLKGKPVQGPPLSDASSASADLFFEIPNPDHAFRIGQKVSVSLVRKSADDSLIVPASAILYDIDGGNWVYTRTAPHVYVRRRVEVSHFMDNFAVLTRGLEAGEEVVVAGAAEIFGTEFGVGK